MNIMKVETKFNVDDKVWLIDNNRVVNATIASVWAFKNIHTNKKVEIRYSMFNVDKDRYESEVFATKEELLASL